MRILVPVDGSGSANRATVYAVSLVDGRPDAEITLLNVQNQGTLDTSDISSVVSVGADTALAADRSEKALRHAIRLCGNAQVKFENRSAFGPIAETIDKAAREVKADQIVMGTPGFSPLRGCGTRFRFHKSGSSRADAGDAGQIDKMIGLACSTSE
jgi:nucleotide-binding universal stress UspA family protein